MKGPRTPPSKDNAMGDKPCPECGKTGDACKCDPGSESTGTANKTGEAPHAPIKPSRKRKAGEIGSYLKTKAKNKGMLADSDPSGDEV